MAHKYGYVLSYFLCLVRFLVYGEETYCFITEAHIPSTFVLDCMSVYTHLIFFLRLRTLVACIEQKKQRAQIHIKIYSLFNILIFLGIHST